MPDTYLPPEVTGWPAFGFGAQDPAATPIASAAPAAPAPQATILPPEVMQALGFGATPTTPTGVPIASGQPAPVGGQPAPVPAPPVELGPGSRTDFKVPFPAPKPAAPPTPTPRPQTPDQQIAAGGQQQQGALAGQADVARAQGGVAAAQATDESALLKQQAEDAAAHEAELRQRAAARVEQRARYQTALDQAVQKEADYKVDPNRYYKDMSTGRKIGNAIAIVMSSVGQAMMGKGGPPIALEIIQQAARDDVDAQLREREHLGKQVGLRQQALKNYMDMTGDEDSAGNLMWAQHLQTAAAQMRSTAAKYASPQARLNAEHVALGLEAQAGALKANVADKLADNDFKRQGLSLQRRAQDIGQSQFAQELGFHKDQFKYQQQKDLNELAEKYAALDQKDRAAAAKHTADAGIFNPVTGDGLLTQKGHEMMAAAAQKESAARTSGDPDERAKLAAEAQQIRDEARTTQVATIDDKEAREKTKEKLGYAQQIVDTSAKIRDFLKTDPATWDRAEWAAVKTQYGDLIAKYIKGIGANASSREFEAVTNHILDFNPDSLWARSFDKGKAEASLNALDGLVKNNVDTTLKGHGIKDGWVPRAAGEAKAETFGGKTTAELGEQGGPSWLGRQSMWATQPFTRNQDIETQKQEARDAAEGRTNARGQSSNYGLDPADESTARSLISAAGRASNEDRARIANTLAQPLLKGGTFDPNAENPATYGERPSLGAGIIHLVRDEDPQLYREILSQLPEYQARAITQFDDLFDSKTGRVRAKAGK